MKDKVSTKHFLYDELKLKREKVQDILGGTEVLRDKASKYLPQFPMELTPSYQNRLNASTLYNVYRKTQTVMTGLVFNDSITLLEDVAKEIIPLAEHIDNEGNHLNVFARKAFDLSFEGCSCILVDAPSTRTSNLAEQQRLGVRPYWALYSADNIINWRYAVNPVNKQKELTLLVLQEKSIEPSGKFESRVVTRYRVYFKDSSGVHLEIYREVDSEKGEKSAVLEQSEITLPVSQIPVGIVGGIESQPPLLDLANLNIKHYQKESNFDNLEVLAAVPLFYTKGLEMEEGQKLVVGADVHYKLSENGQVGWSQIDSSGFDSLRQSLKAIEEDMSVIGLSMLTGETARVDMTATEAIFDNIAETAQLRVMGVQLQDTLELCLGHTAEFLGLPRNAGGSIKLGAIWNADKNTFSSNLDEMNRKADIANKLSGIMSSEWLIKFLGVSGEDEMQEILRQVRSQDVIVVEK